MNTPSVRFFHRVIEYSFYAIFFLVPLVLTSNTSELFEFNKLWLTFALTIIIVAAWVSKMILTRRIFIQRTPLDIPIVLFLASQIISTIFSLDSHVSLWGYYSRFNGGLLSIISYIVLYYSFVSNLNDVKMVKRLLLISLISGAIVALWGLPSHFGYDPTCWLFRGTLDVSCWTDQFKPTIRMFSTLGQPDWLAAYLAILVPIAIAFALNYLLIQTESGRKYQILNIKYRISKKTILTICFLLFTILFYIDLIYTDARSGFLGFWIGLSFFTVVLVAIKSTAKKTLLKSFAIILGIFLLINFFLGTPIVQFDPFTFEGVKMRIGERFSPPSLSPSSTATSKETKPLGLLEQTRITDSGHIRLIVWEGALNIWKNNPLFGSGVETFAFAYYKNRPVEHNMTSEWDYLYNKAHNEYLNFLSTTGIFGLGTYLLMIAWFLVFSTKRMLYTNHLKFEISNYWKLVIIALLSAYVSILVTNFFGFSVVMVNLFLFLIPAFVFILMGKVNEKNLIVYPKEKPQQHHYADGMILASVTLIIWIIALFFIFTLFQYWRADQQYYLGSNLNKVSRYQEAYPYLQSAVLLRNDEPVFKDEISVANAVLAVAYWQNKDTQTATTLTKEAVAMSNQIVNEHPNNVLFWKTRTRVLYSLSQLNKEYLPLALEAIKQANILAPTDAKVSYNLGLLYGQNGDSKKAIEVLEKTIKMKSDYREAYYALGLFYHELAIDKDGKVIHPDMQEKAVKQMRYILDHLIREDQQAKEALKTWGETI